MNYSKEYEYELCDKCIDLFSLPISDSSNSTSENSARSLISLSSIACSAGQSNENSCNHWKNFSTNNLLDVLKRLIGW